jgi:hypothetical protein
VLPSQLRSLQQRSNTYRSEGLVDESCQPFPNLVQYYNERRTMSKTPETKVAEQLINLTESHWFNPATLGRYMADQPLYTIDRVMEMIAQTIHYLNKRYGQEQINGRTSEGLLLAAKLDKTIKSIKHTDNIKLPKEARRMIEDIIPARYSHIRESNTQV